MRGLALVPIYRPGRSWLHRTATVPALSYLAGLVALAFAVEGPLPVAILLLSLTVLIAATGLVARLKGYLYAALLLGLLVVAINPLVAQGGDTLLVRGPILPVLGAVNVTLESLAYGLLVAARTVSVVVIFGLLTVAVDPDQILSKLRRLGFRSALTVGLATRLVPVAGRDALRMGEAALCRYGARRVEGRLSRLRLQAQVFNALIAQTLDRSLDVAMALEVRGFGRRRPARLVRARWARLDLVSIACGLAAATLAVVGLSTGALNFRFYPRLADIFAPSQIALAGVTCVLALLPPLAWYLQRWLAR